MARLVLHIGAHKTGTSFLQRMMFFNRNALARHGVHYPDLGPSPAHHILAAPWIDIPEIPADDYGPGGPDGFWQRFVDQYAPTDGTVFLSAESFSRAARQSVDMADLRRRLEAFEEVRAIYVVRRQPELIQSIWLQVSKSASPPDFRQFCRNAIRNHMCSGLWVDHGKVYDHLLTAFAPEEITFWDYDDIRRRPGGVLQAFLDDLSCPLKAADFPPLGREHANLSPDALATYVACRIAAPARPDDKLTRQVMRALAHLPDGKTTAFTRAEYKQVLDHFAPLNADLTERIAHRQPGFVFDAGTEPPEGMIWRETIPNPVWLRLANSIHHDR